MCGDLAAGCLAMMVTIATSGGIGGFGLGKEAKVELDALPAGIREEACTLLVPDRLSRLERESRAPGKQGGADRITYRIELEHAGGVSTYEIGEAAMSPEMLDMIDAMVAEQK
jgi:hypothetical protein